MPNPEHWTRVGVSGWFSCIPVFATLTSRDVSLLLFTIFFVCDLSTPMVFFAQWFWREGTHSFI